MAGEFLMRRRVQFAETDMAGVLHFSNYYRLMEEVEHAFWRSISESVVSRDGQMSWPRVATSCKYLAPARFEDELELAFSVTSVGARSVTYEVEFRRDARRIALGKTTAVCCLMAAGSFQPIDIPDRIRAELSAALNGAKSDTVAREGRRRKPGPQN